MASFDDDLVLAYSVWFLLTHFVEHRWEFGTSNGVMRRRCWEDMEQTSSENFTFSPQVDILIIFNLRCVDWHPHKGIVVSGSKDNQQPIKLWDPKSGQVCVCIWHLWHQPIIHVLSRFSLQSMHTNRQSWTVLGIKMATGSSLPAEIICSRCYFSYGLSL